MVTRKIRNLLETDAEVVVVSPDISTKIRSMRTPLGIDDSPSDQLLEYLSHNPLILPLSICIFWIFIILIILNL